MNGGVILHVRMKKYHALMRDISVIILISTQLTFFNRNGKWGFDEITCVKNSQEGKGYTVKNVSTENIPHWVK